MIFGIINIFPNKSFCIFILYHFSYNLFFISSHVVCSHLYHTFLSIHVWLINSHNSLHLFNRNYRYASLERCYRLLLLVCKLVIFSNKESYKVIITVEKSFNRGKYYAIFFYFSISCIRILVVKIFFDENKRGFSFHGKTNEASV